MKPNTTTCKTKNYNKTAYTVFVLAGIYFAIVKDFSQAFTFLGLALIFDPFKQAMAADKRPRWQRSWLVIHFFATLALLAMLFCLK